MSVRSRKKQSAPIKRPTDLPDFKQPPVSEVVLSLQFEPLERLKTPLIGCLWERFRKRLPEIEEHAPLPSIMEMFGTPAASLGPKIEVIMGDKPPVPRVFFMTPEKTELVQIQQDRFIHNWRKIGGQDTYPRYEVIREAFRQEVTQLQAFLNGEKAGHLKINQCEITYVNHIEPCGVWNKHNEMDAVLRNWVTLSPGGFLPLPEDAGIRLRFVMPDEEGRSIGRLHVAFDPVWRTSDKSPLFSMNLTARGTPLTGEIDGAFEFLDVGRRWIVKGFADLTTDKMHRAWGRIQ
jgi:uncharacterized protein (TIGR04255 family)